MQGRSWMAALTVAVGIVLPLARPAVAEEKPVTNYKVQLDLKIAGLPARRGGCDVEIKPGHSGCQFQPVSRHVDWSGLSSLVLNDVRTTSPDRECAFAITIREPGQPARTFRRGLRLALPQKAPVSKLECYLSSPSKLAMDVRMRQTR